MLFDWLRRRAGSVSAAAAREWRVSVEDGMLVVVELGQDRTFARSPMLGARSVRVVPLTRGAHHASASGWQVALAQLDGDVLVGQPLPDWQSARALARKVCAAAALPMDPTTEKLFSRVGQIKL